MLVPRINLSAGAKGRADHWTATIIIYVPQHNLGTGIFLQLWTEGFICKLPVFWGVGFHQNIAEEARVPLAINGGLSTQILIENAKTFKGTNFFQIVSIPKTVSFFIWNAFYVGTTGKMILWPLECNVREPLCLSCS